MRPTEFIEEAKEREPLSAASPCYSSVYPVLSEKRSQSSGQSLRVALKRLAFPNHEHFPALGMKPFDPVEIPCDVAVDLRLPVFLSAGRSTSSVAVVAMPKTTVDEHCLSSPPEDDIGPARQFGRVKAVPVAHRMQESTDCHLRLRVLLPHRPHDPASLLGREYVHGR